MSMVAKIVTKPRGVMRVSGADVMRDADAVANAILALAESPLHHALHGPPPRAGED